MAAALGEKVCEVVRVRELVGECEDAAEAAVEGVAGLVPEFACVALTVVVEVEDQQRDTDCVPVAAPLGDAEDVIVAEKVLIWVGNAEGIVGVGALEAVKLGMAVTVGTGEGSVWVAMGEGVELTVVD